MKKTELVLEHLKSGRTLTQIEAFEKYKTTRLASIVKNLRNRGYDIVTMMHYETTPEEVGAEPVRWAEYFLKGE